MSVIFLSVDLQNDFATEGGAQHQPRSSVQFIQDTLLPVRSGAEVHGC